MTDRYDESYFKVEANVISFDGATNEMLITKTMDFFGCYNDHSYFANAEPSSRVKLKLPKA